MVYHFFSLTNVINIQRLFHHYYSIDNRIKKITFCTYDNVRKLFSEIKGNSSVWFNLKKFF